MIKIYYKSMKEGNIYQKWDGGKENRQAVRKLNKKIPQTI